MKPFQIAYQHACRHGIVAAIHLPTEPEPLPSTILERLHPREAERACALTGLRQISFVGGRLAMRLAAQQLGVVPSEIATDEHGAPQLPRGLVGSISHKRDLAVALVSRDHGATIGVDLENYGPPRLGIAPKVLTAEELAELRDLDKQRRWIGVLLRFSLKESIYKALNPWVRRYIGFHEARVFPDTDGLARVELALANDEGPFHADGAYQWWHGRLLTTVRVRRPTGAPVVQPGPDPG